MRFLVFLAFMVLATHVSAQQAQGVPAEGPSVHKQAQGNADANKGNAWKSALPVTIIESPDEANHATERETKSDKHDAEDLDAQVRAANAAERGATAAEWQVIPTIAQAVFGFFGMGLLIAATIYARRSAIHAGEAVVVTRDIGEAQTRAYISITKARVAIVPHKGAGYGDHPLFEFEVKNSGNSPAISFRWFSITVYVYSDADGTLYGNNGFSPDNWATDIASQEAKPISSHDLSSFLREADMTAFAAGDLHIIVTIKTTYKDVFKKEISDTYNFAAHFPTGAGLNTFVALVKWPASAEETAFMTSEGKRLAAGRAK